MLKKILIGIGGLIGLLALAAVVFLWPVITAPSQDELCTHVKGLLEKQSAGAGDAVDCGDFKPPEFGKLPWAKQAKCIMDAEDAAGVADCEKRRKAGEFKA